MLAPLRAVIKKESKGLYDDYIYKSNVFYLTNSETNKRSEPVIFAASLVNTEHTKGSDRAPNGVKYIVFDEFMTRDTYLPNEFVSFSNVISSFVRNRKGTVIYLLRQYGF